MRILLINPFYPISETPSPPLGLAYLAGALEAAGMQVKVLDLVVYPHSRSELESTLSQFAPRLVGLTAVTMTIHNALAVAGEIKAIDPAIPIVLGGPHATFHARPTLLAAPQLDFILRGEGEASLVALARALDKGRGWERIPGLVHQCNGTIHENPSQPPPVDVHNLPQPARHLLPLGRYRALGMPVSMTSSRGCPHGCIFCVGGKMFGRAVRRRRPEAVVTELALLNELGFHQINLADDLFTAHRDHCLSVCDEILNRGLVCRWTAFARVDTVSPVVLERMKAAGCHTISFGVESGNAAMLRRIRKGITRRQVRTAMHMCIRAGIDPHASFILGLPGETPQSLTDTVAFGQELKEMGVSHGFHVLAPFPGTAIHDQLHRFDLKILTHDWSQYHANRAVTETATVNAAMVNDIVIRYEEKFNQWLGRLDRRRACGKATPEEAWPLTRLEHTVRLYDLMMQRTIENQGQWSATGSRMSRQNALSHLADRIGRCNGHSRRDLLESLTFAASQNWLQLERCNGRVRWHWAE